MMFLVGCIIGAKIQIKTDSSKEMAKELLFLSLERKTKI
jgi:hypothetical protein